MQTIYRKGTKVYWKWWRGYATGKIIEKFTSTIRKTIKGSSITRKGTKDNPAYLIEQENGAQVLKLHSELQCS